MSSVVLLENLALDFKYTLRGLRRSFGFSATVLITLAVGTSAVTALFTAVNAVLWRQLPVRQPERLAALSSKAATGGELNGVPSTFLEDLRNTPLVANAFSYTTDGLSLSINAPAQRIVGEVVTPNYFNALGARPVLGSAFRAQDAWSAQAVLSYRSWKRFFEGDPNVVGRVVRLHVKLQRIIGVMPEAFFGTEVGFSPDLWIPILPMGQSIPQIALASQDHPRMLNTVVRLKDGVSLPAASAAINATFTHFVRDHGVQQFDGSALSQLIVTSGARGTSALRANFATPLLLMLGAVALLLLTICINIANLLLARLQNRRQDIYVRLALGASYGSLQRQTLTETLALSTFGGLLGFAFVPLVTHIVFGFLPQTHLGVSMNMHPDAGVFLFSAALVVIIALLLGIAPALELKKSPIAGVLKQDSAGSVGVSRQQSWFYLKRFLVISQVALAVVLLACASLIARNLQVLESNDLGYDANGLLLFTMKPQPEIYKPERIDRIMSEVLRRVTELPGVTSAAWAEHGPLDSRGIDTLTLSTTGGKSVSTLYDYVGPKLFPTVGLMIVAGRDFSPVDAAKAGSYVVVSKLLANELFPNGDAVGHTLYVGDTPSSRKPVEIIGIVRESKYADVHLLHAPMVYLAIQGNAYMPTLHVKANPQEYSVLYSEIRNQFTQVDSDIPVFNIKTLRDRVNESLARERLTAALSSVFAIIALTIAATGLYATISYLAGRRTREIAVRVAMGAVRADIVWIIVREALALMGIGAAVGAAGSIVLARVLSNALSGIHSADPVALLAAIGIVCLITVLSAFMPAWRACRIDPATTLRFQ